MYVDILIRIHKQSETEQLPVGMCNTARVIGTNIFP